MTTELSYWLVRVSRFLLRQGREIREGGLSVLLRKVRTFQEMVLLMVPRSAYVGQDAACILFRKPAGHGLPVYKDMILRITADSGGSNGYRIRLWKMELQKFADETGQEITVSHLPQGTSKRNKIVHRLFSFITQNWRGKPL